MALTATIHNLTVDLANHDRHVFEALDLKVARHPSESPEYLVTRVLAFCLEFTEGIAFSRGVSDPDEPAIMVRDLTGAVTCWIEIGLPDAARLHKACKASPRVVVYTHRDPDQWLRGLEGQRIHRAGTLDIFAMDRALISELAGRLARRMDLAVSIADGDVSVSIGETFLTGALRRCVLPS